MNPVSLEMCEDRLSNLPGHLKEMIISCLPIQEAFRTSILSTEWRHTTRGLSQLVFEDQPTWSEARFIDVVDHVLSNHGVGLIKFMVSGVGRVDIGAVDRWVSCVSDLSVQELILRMSHGSEDLHHRISNRLYTNHQLTYLHLISCSLVQPPRAFTGFRNLKKIVFNRVFMPEGAADIFFDHCQSLEELILARIIGCSVLYINAPKLKFLVVSSSFNEITLVNTKRLSHVIMHKLDSPPEATVNGQGNLVKFFSVLPSVQVLTIGGHFMKHLAVGLLPRSMLFSQLCSHLRTLSICINMTNLDQMLASLCLMRSCPALQDLELRAPDGEEIGLDVAAELSGWMDTYRSMFNQLCVITLKNVTDLNVEREYIRLLLLCTPVNA